MEQNRKVPSVFSLLGWEAAIILKNVCHNFKDDYNDGSKIIGLLKKIHIEGPRGNLKLDEKTNYFITPVLKASIKNNKKNVEIKLIEDVSENWKAFAVNSSEEISSGWSNTYLCY